LSAALESPRVRHRPLGTTGITVSEIGFGTWGIGGRTSGETSYGATDDSISRRALDRAVGCGIDFFDTAAAYGDGHSEELLGELANRTSQPLVFSTKAGIPKFGETADFSPVALQASLTSSKRRLAANRVDGLLLHNPTPQMIKEDRAIVDFLEGCVRAGDIRFWGLSVKSPADGIAMLQAAHVPVMQVNLNMLDVRAVTSGLLDLAQRQGTAVIARTPLCFGFLSGHVDETTTFPPGDHRNAWSPAQRKAWAEGARRAWALAEPAAGESMAQTALRFCLSFPAVSLVLPGPMTEAEVEDNAGASARGPLAERAVAGILELNRTTDFFVRG